ncbi:MAG TPA: hypothetical protein VEW93_02485 [Acidimicrobiales bacterium]|nr:hypothetical protein [Acidimicrobiales bacterium]
MGAKDRDELAFRDAPARHHERGVGLCCGEQVGDVVELLGPELRHLIGGRRVVVEVAPRVDGELGDAAHGFVLVDVPEPQAG